MSRCPSCPNLHRQVHGYGPNNAKVMVIADRPVAAEDRSGFPIDGPAGAEFDSTYLPLAGLSRDDIYATCAMQCRCERNGQDVQPTESLLHSCAANHLPEEIWNVSPQIIILLGAAACTLGGTGAGRIDLELEHGRPRMVADCAGLGGWSGTVVPTYAPAAGIREGRFMIYSLEDWEKLGLWMRGKLQFPKTELERHDYRLLTTKLEVRDYLSCHLDQWPAIDTESDEDKTWSVQVSFAPGHGAMIRVEDRAALDEFAAGFNHYIGNCIMHHAVHDLDELDQVGIHVQQHRDTMQELYHLGNLPQGLKAAVYRTLGHRMISYMETVVPHSKAVLDAWLCEAMVWASEHRIVEPHPPGPGCPTCGKKHRLDVSKHKPHESEAVLRRIMGKLQEEGSDYDPWQKPKLQHGEEKPRLLGRPWLPEMEQAMRRMPRRSIVHVPIAEAVQYGCSDADWTLRLAGWLEHERERIIKQEWRVAA